MSEIKAIEKLRESSHLDDNKWTLENGEVVTIFGADPTDQNAVNWGEQWRKLADEIEAEIAERYMPLPLDADGVPIRVGNVVEFGENRNQGIVKALNEHMVIAMHTDDGCMNYAKYSLLWNADACRHVKERTVEDVLEDFLADYDDWDDGHTFRCDREKMRAELFEKYADEIRELLGGDAE